MVNFKIIRSALFALLLSGCAGEIPASKPATDSDFSSSVAITQLTHRLAYVLNKNSDMDKNELTLVSTPVSTSNLNSSNELGLQIQEGLITGMQAKGYKLVDVNVAKNLRVTANSNLMLSRDWKQIAPTMNIDNVLVTTMSLSKDGVVVNSRIVGYETKIIKASATEFISGKDLPGYINYSNVTTMQNDVIYRDAIGTKAVSIIRGNQ